MFKQMLILLILLKGAFLFAEGGKKLPLTFRLYGGFSQGMNKLDVAGTALDNNTGVSYGLGVDLGIMPQLAVGIDFLCIEKGYLLITNGVSNRYRLNYFEIPILVQWVPNRYFVLKFGPYLVSQIISATREGIGESSAIKGDFSNDYGLTLGMWIGFPATKSLGVGLDLRFDYGLNDVKAGGNPLSPLKTRAFISMLSVQYSL